MALPAATQIACDLSAPVNAPLGRPRHEKQCISCNRKQLSYRLGLSGSRISLPDERSKVSGSGVQKGTSDQPGPLASLIRRQAEQTGGCWGDQPGLDRNNRPQLLPPRFEPHQQSGPGIGKKIKLNRPLCFQLHDDYPPSAGRFILSTRLRQNPTSSSRPTGLTHRREQRSWYPGIAQEMSNWRAIGPKALPHPVA